jgi:hypothetical protein
MSIMRWRERLLYLAMSLVVGWHSLAILVAPMPESSTLVQTFRALVQPYLSLFRLDNKWHFFVPLGKYAQFRYIVEDTAGKQHLFVPLQEASDSVARYVMWRELKYFYEGLMEAPAIRGERIVTLLCRKHVALKPVSVALLQAQELDFLPDDYLRGASPLDPEFVSVSTLAHIKC